MAPAQDDYEILSQVVRTTEDVTYKEIRKLALTSNKGLTAAQLQGQLRELFGTPDQYSDCPDEDDLVDKSILLCYHAIN